LGEILFTNPALGIVRFMKKENWISSCFWLVELPQLNLDLCTKKKKASTELLFSSLFLIFYLASKLCHMAMVELIIMMYGCGRVVVLLSIFFYQNSPKRNCQVL